MSNDGEPMEVDDDSMSQDYTESQENAQKSLPNSGDPHDDTTNEVVKDTIKVIVQAEWKNGRPQKWELQLQKALQSLFNDNWKEEKMEVVKIHELSDEHCSAVVEITPPSALNTLIKTKTATLKQDVTVQFFYDMESLDRHNREIAREITAEGTTGMKADLSLVEPPGRTDPSTFTLPVNLYWYLSHVYRKEINQLEKEFGVTIDAEVSVSISAKSDNTKRDSVHKAVQRFTGLVQNNSESLDIIPISQVDMESDIVKEALHNIPNAEAKMMLNRSADTCLFFAPKQLTSVLQKRMNTSNTSDVSSNRTSQDKSGTLKMDIKDTQASVVMDETHWKLLRVAFKTQIVDIQNKYGVEFHFENDQGLIKVKSQSKGTLVNLETHALRALQHLYQKVVVSTITCAPDSAETVTQFLKRLHSQLIRVDLSTKYRDHKFAGLPMHLLPAIADIENEIGKSVFDDGSKQSLGYSDYLAQRMAQQGVGAKGGAGGADLKDRTEADMSDFSSLQMKEAKGNAKDKGNVTSEEENCPICMDTFIDKIKLKCGHEYCKQCLDMSEKSMGKICPVCKKIFGRLIGNQPEGKMTYHETRDRLPGFPDYGTIVINYSIPSGIQTEKHPSPGQPYVGTSRTAYLPDSKEGKHVLDLLKIAFNQKLIFTVGTSTTTGAKNTVTWNDIHHKTNMHGGPVSYGYPDDDYLKRVQAELKAKGIE